MTKKPLGVVEVKGDVKSLTLTSRIQRLMTECPLEREMTSHRLLQNCAILLPLCTEVCFRATSW